MTRNLFLLSCVTLGLAGCSQDYDEPRLICAEKANLRMVASRGGSYEAFDCQRWVLKCIEPLELYQDAGMKKPACRLARKEP